MLNAPLSGRHVALAALLNCACPALTLDPIVTDGTTGAPPDPATGQATDGDGTTTAPATGDPSTTGAPETTTGISPEATGDTTTATTSTTDEMAGTTGPFVCVGDIVGNADCDGPNAYCLDGTCVNCTELDCAQIVPGRPVCSEDLGICVECQQNADCSAEAPACDPATRTCVLCNDHDQCPATACNLETGECFPEDSVLYVDNSPDAPIPCSDVPPLPWGTSPQEPVCTLQNALMRVVEGQPTTIKIKTGSKAQNGVSEVPIGDFTIAIRHDGITVPSLIVSFTDPALTINEGNLVFMHRIGVYNMMPVSDPLIQCAGGATGARLWLDRQRIFGGRTAVRADNCRVHVRRANITGHTTGGIDIGGNDGDLAKLWVENSYMTENNGTKFGAIRIGGTASLDILYSTIALNEPPAPLAPIECVDNWSGQMTIRNSVIVNQGPLYGAGCTANVTTSFELPDAPNKAALADVFAGFADGVFTAELGGALKGVAVWKTGDPASDIDEDPRPTVDGSSDYAGADHATP